MSDSFSLERASQYETFLERVMAGVPADLAGMEVGWTPAQLRRHLTDPQFAELVEGAKGLRDDGVEAALYNLAIEKKNMAAITMILMNRRPDDWKDVKRIEVKTETNINIRDVQSIKAAVKQLMLEGGVEALQIGGVIDVESEEQ